VILGYFFVVRSICFQSSSGFTKALFLETFLLMLSRDTLGESLWLDLWDVGDRGLWESINAFCKVPLFENLVGELGGSSPKLVLEYILELVGSIIPKCFTNISCRVSTECIILLQ
jgi:hypothetical protein